LINGTLIDGTGSDPITGVVIVIEDNLITAVGKLSEIKQKENLRLKNKSLDQCISSTSI